AILEKEWPGLQGIIPVVVVHAAMEIVRPRLRDHGYALSRCKALAGIGIVGETNLLNCVRNGGQEVFTLFRLSRTRRYAVDFITNSLSIDAIDPGAGNHHPALPGVAFEVVVHP